MKNKKIDFIWLTVSILSFLIFSASFLMMPFESAAAKSGFSILSHLSGLVFWVSLLIAAISQTVLSARRRKRNAATRIRRTKDSQNVGVFSFMKNKLAVVFDVLFVASLIAFIVSLIITHGLAYVCYVFVSVMVFSFAMHCILNGKIYNELMYDNKSDNV